MKAERKNPGLLQPRPSGMVSSLNGRLMATVLLASACGAELNDPKTILRDDLNPPYALAALGTQDNVLLQWNVSNTESDLEGYSIFVARSSLADLEKKLTGELAGKNLSTSSLNRCEANKEVFAAFGFDPTTTQARKKCSESDVRINRVGDGTGEGDTRPSGLEVQPVKCLSHPAADPEAKDLGNGLYSVLAEKAVTRLGEPFAPADQPAQRIGKTLRCYVANPESFTTGDVYTAFVVAAQDDGTEVSFTSPFVEFRPGVYQKLPTISLGNGTGVNLQLPTAAPLSLTKTDGVIGKRFPCPQGDRPNSYCGVAKTGFTQAFASSGAAVPLLPFVALLEDLQEGSNRAFVLGQKDRVYLAKIRSQGEQDDRAGILETTDGNSAPALTSGTRDLVYRSDVTLPLYPGNLFSLAVVEQDGSTSYGKIYVEGIGPDAAQTGMTLDLWVSLESTAPRETATARR